MCGGTGYGGDGALGGVGLSPRVRGNLALAGGSLGRLRSIPACAGEPPVPMVECAGSGVYPRVCGGTRVAVTTANRAAGLSPRVRGNLTTPPECKSPLRSIPACAGEPGARNTRSIRDTVYPRVCGGTIQGPVQGVRQLGLSPRVRGNLVGRHPAHRYLRSIPACAGEPPSSSAPSQAWTVYPRVCGGTRQPRRHNAAAAGLSPRVRGNH